jgi:hypothetical protein
LLELTTGGKNRITLSNGETRGFLEDGDTVVLRAYCEGAGARRIGFGECRGTVLPAERKAELANRDLRKRDSSKRFASGKPSWSILVCASP